MQNINKIKILISALVVFGIASFFLFSADKKSENQNIQSLLDGFTKYTHPTTGFSLEHPEYLEIKSFKEKDDGETIIFQKNGDKSEWPGEQKTGFQIFAIPFEDEVNELTKEKILKDLPNVVIEELAEVIIGEKAGRPIRAFVFWSNDARIGKTRELWFIDRGYLFEVTTYQHLDGLLAQIMSTWNFEIK